MKLMSNLSVGASHRKLNTVGLWQLKWSLANTDFTAKLSAREDVQRMGRGGWGLFSIINAIDDVKNAHKGTIPIVMFVTGNNKINSVRMPCSPVRACTVSPDPTHYRRCLMRAHLISIRVGSINPPFHIKIKLNTVFLMEPQYKNKWCTHQNLGANKVFKVE